MRRGLRVAFFIYSQQKKHRHTGGVWLIETNYPRLYPDVAQASALGNLHARTGSPRLRRLRRSPDLTVANVSNQAL